MTEFTFQRKRINSVSEMEMLDELEKVAKHFNYTEFGRDEFDRIPMERNSHMD